MRGVLHMLAGTAEVIDAVPFIESYVIIGLSVAGGQNLSNEEGP